MRIHVRVSMPFMTKDSTKSGKSAADVTARRDLNLFVACSHLLPHHVLKIKAVPFEDTHAIRYCAPENRHFRPLTRVIYQPRAIPRQQSIHNGGKKEQQ